jgi:hypothetical protein
MRSTSRRAPIAVTISTITLLAASAAAQTGGWRPPADDAAERYGSNQAAASGAPTAARPPQAAPITPINSAPGPMAPQAPLGPQPTRARVSKGAGSLPNNGGQVWREYDISPYTSRVTTTNRPEQTIVDWILRETGYESWHSDPIGVLSSNRQTLTVYHTPEMQAVVADIVDRFVNQQADAYAFSIRIATVVNPNWRANALPIMTPIPVQTPGIQGWLLHKEDARLLVSELSRRTDYREFNSPQQLIGSGQSIVISTMRPRQYVRSAVATQASWPGYQPEMGTIDEGFSLEFSPLLGIDSSTADAVVKLRLNQIEKLVPVKLDLPTTVAPNQRVQVEVPQLTMANIHERFRWPTEQVLLLSMGVVATPAPTKDNPITDTINSAIPMLKDPPRADALLLIECRGNQTPSHSPEIVRSATLPANSFHGRY